MEVIQSSNQTDTDSSLRERKTMKTVIISLAVVQLLIAGFGALVGSFADGGEWWERAVLSVHPIVAVALLIIVALPRPTDIVIRLGLALLLINVVADASLSLMIRIGISKGDWWLPLIFAVIPAIAIIHLQSSLRRSDVRMP